MGRFSITLFSFAALLCSVSSMGGQHQHHHHHQQNFQVVAPGAPSHSNQGPANPWDWNPAPSHSNQGPANPWDWNPAPSHSNQGYGNPWDWNPWPQEPQWGPNGGFPGQHNGNNGPNGGAQSFPPVLPPIAPGGGAPGTASPKSVGGKAPRPAVPKPPPKIALQFAGKSLQFVCSALMINGTGVMSDQLDILVRHRFPTKAAAMLLMNNPLNIAREVGTGEWACAFKYFATHNADIAGGFSDVVDGGCDFSCNPMRGPWHPPAIAKMAKLAMGGGAGVQGLLKGLAPTTNIFSGLPGLDPLANMPGSPWGAPQHNNPFGGPSHSPFPFGYDPNAQNNAMGKPFPAAAELAGQNPSQQNSNPFGQTNPYAQKPGSFPGQPNNNQYQPNQHMNNQMNNNQYHPNSPPDVNQYPPHTHPNNNQFQPNPSSNNNQYQPNPQPNNNQYQPNPQPNNNQYQPNPQPNNNQYQPNPQPNNNQYQPNPQPNNNQYQPDPQPNNNHFHPKPQTNNNQFPSNTHAFGTMPPHAPPPPPPSQGMSVSMPGAPASENVEIEPAIAMELMKMNPVERKKFINDAITAHLAMSGFMLKPNQGAHPSNGMNGYPMSGNPPPFVMNGFPTSGSNPGASSPGSGSNQPSNGLAQNGYSSGMTGSGQPSSQMNQNGYPGNGGGSSPHQYSTGGVAVDGGVSTANGMSSNPSATNGRNNGRWP